MTESSGARRAGVLAWLGLAGMIVFYFAAVPVQASLIGGGASWYAMAGNRTASGETMNPGALTAAHRTLPFGTRVEVKNLGNGRTVVVRINDRGPFVRGRVIDVSRAAAKRLGFVRAGTARVRLRVVARPGGRAPGRKIRNRTRTGAPSRSWRQWLNDLVR